MRPRGISHKPGQRTKARKVSCLPSKGARLNNCLKVARKMASGSGEAPRVLAVQLDERTLATIIQGVTERVQEALRENGGIGERRRICNRGGISRGCPLQPALLQL